jgi:uncharacterized protein YndB with AHSA1/START domain
MVWKAWTDPQQVAKWWGPDGFTSRVDTWDVTPGGQLKLTMIAGPELDSLAGLEAPMAGEFTEIEKPSKLVFRGNAIMDGKEILQNVNTVTLEEVDGKTKITVHVVVTKAVMPDAEMPLLGMEMGWNQQLDKLVEFIKRQ